MAIYLPSEMYFIIFSFINDTNTYLSCRLVCKKWYDFLNIIHIFKNYKLVERVYFYENEILFKNINNTIIAKCLFKKYGYYEYISYGLESIKIKSEPFKLKKEIMNYSYNEKINYNIFKDEKKQINQRLPGCSLM